MNTTHAAVQPRTTPPLDLVAHCADPFCQRPIYFGDRSVFFNGGFYCNESCFAGAAGAIVVKAGTEERTI